MLSPKQKSGEIDRKYSVREKGAAGRQTVIGGKPERWPAIGLERGEAVSQRQLSRRGKRRRDDAPSSIKDDVFAKKFSYFRVVILRFKVSLDS